MSGLVDYGSSDEDDSMREPPQLKVFLSRFHDMVSMSHANEAGTRS